MQARSARVPLRRGGLALLPDGGELPRGAPPDSSGKVAIMSKTKITTDTVASTLSGISSQIQSVSLSKAERRLLQGRNENAPDELIEMVCHLAEQGGGNVLGMPFDVATTRATLAQASDTRTALSVGRQTLERMEDDMIQQRATAADPAFAIYTALRRLVKTKAGNSLAPAYAQMQAIVKNRPRKTRKKTAKAAASEATTTPVAAAPAAPAPSTPAAAPKAVVSTSN
jgi:hypothetical protein